MGDSAGRRALLVAGVVQSVAAEDAGNGYWEAMLPEHRPESGLLLGVGGGTLAHLMVRRFGGLAITGIDESAVILDLARRSFGLDLLPIELIEADAFAFIHRTTQRWDFIALDLYRGNHLVRGSLALPFLKQLAARLYPGGTIACNLFRDVYLAERLGRLERVFERTRIVDVAANSAFHGRPRPRYR